MSQEVSLVWAKWEGTWYAALLMPAESLGIDAIEENQTGVLILDEEDWAVALDAADVVPFDLDESRLADPKAASSVAKAMQFLQVPPEVDGGVDSNVGEGKDKKDKKDKKAKKEERRREKERKREEKMERKKRERSPTASPTASEGDDDEDEVVDRRGGDDDGLDAFIRSDTQGKRGGVGHRHEAVLSRLHDRSKSSRTTEYGAADLFLSSASPTHANSLYRAKQWLSAQLSECAATGKIMTMHEVELLRAVEERLSANSAMLAALKSNVKSLSGKFKEQIKNEIDALETFDVEGFCASVCVLVYMPERKPEKRKGPRYFCLDPHLVDLLDIGKPDLKELDREQLSRIEVEDRGDTVFSKSGLVKPRIMRQWLSGRELAVVGKSFDVQPVAAHGAVARRFSEFVKANETKALNKASRSVEFSRYLSQTKHLACAPGSDPRSSIGSYFNFHDFRDYEQQASILHDSELYPDIASNSVPPELALEFDPDAAFNFADNDLAGALQAFEQSGRHVGISAQRSSLAIPSDQSMWGAESSVVSTDQSPTPVPRASTSSGNAPPSGLTPNQHWHKKVIRIITNRASLYVFGSHSRPKCLPQDRFNDVVKKCLQRASDVQNKRDRTLSILGSNAATWELSARDETNIGASVEHYIKRHFLNNNRDEGTGRGASRAHSASHRARSASRHADYD